MINTHTDKNIPRDNADMSNEKNKSFTILCKKLFRLKLMIHRVNLKFTASKFYNVIVS